MGKSIEHKKGFKKTKIGWIPEEWQLSQIKDCLFIENNKRTPISKTVRQQIQGRFPYYGPTRIQDYINNYQYDGRYALIAEDGDHFLKYRNISMTQLVNGKFNVNNHAHVLKGSVSCTTDWFYWYYNRKSVYGYITRQGAGRFKLNKQSLEKLPIPLPPLPEQRKIAEILSTWDKAIEHSQKLIELLKQRKKGLMQQLLTGKTRLKGFEGEWKKVRLSELIIESSRKSDIQNQYPLLTSSKSGICLQSKYFKREVASSNNIGYKIIAKGQFTYRSMSDTESFTFNCLKEYKLGLISPAYSVFYFQNANSIFMEHYLNDYYFSRYIRKVIQGGTRSALKLNALKQIKCPLPSIKEQDAIAEVLVTVDKQIEAYENYLLQLQEQKKGLMQQLLTGKKRVKV